MFPGALAEWAELRVACHLRVGWEALPKPAHSLQAGAEQDCPICRDSHFIFQKLGSPQSPVNNLKGTQNECVTTLGSNEECDKYLLSPYQAPGLVWGGETPAKQDRPGPVLGGQCSGRDTHEASRDVNSYQLV